MLLKIATARPKERPSGFIGNFSVNFLQSNALMPINARGDFFRQSVVGAIVLTFNLNRQACSMRAKRRAALEKTPLGPRDFPRVISRASGCKIPARGKSRGPRGCIFRYIPPLVSVRTFSHPRQGGIRFNTVRLHHFVVVVGEVGLMGEVEVVRGSSRAI